MFQNANSPIMEQLILFHDYSLLILILILTMVSYIMIIILINKIKNYYILSGQFIEIVWTIFPALILLILAFPSLKLLYLMEEMNSSFITIKTLGNQWYWKYEYSNFNIEFDSYMNNNLNNMDYRLLETDNRVVLPMKNFIRILVSSSDVLHSWTIPSLGVKVDAVPGRLNSINCLINKSTLLYGQCSEICGTNHSFMPISIEAINMNYFLNWLKNFNN
uniref:Cytochrome c oxidase subunit 2 n=1 Tax=Cecidomyiidae sp. 3 LC-2017 TaxID=2030135 RepID=A0A343LA43_9DIPT|nr:cytochrome c oxidase subunit 2 [Cecidomyiidae sp. 3 LC-2017]